MNVRALVGVLSIGVASGSVFGEGTPFADGAWKPLAPRAEVGVVVGAEDVGPERGGVLMIDQISPSAVVGSFPSQQLPDNPNFDTYVFDDFRTTRPFQVAFLQMAGQDDGDPGCNVAVIGEIWQGRPGDGGVLVMSGTGNQIGQDLQVDFLGQVLPPGEYLITAFVVRPFSSPCAGGQWNCQVGSNLSGKECGVWNPGNGLGFGPDILKMSDAIAQPDIPPLDPQISLIGFLDDFQDCNSNGTDDYFDILLGDSFDTNLNGVPDECERFGLGGAQADYDLDGIPDLDDPEPTIYNTWPDLPPIQVELEQLSFPATPYNQPALTTEHGMVRLKFPTDPFVYLYVNVEIDGVWAVQNRLVYTDDLPLLIPQQCYTWFFDLGVPRGTPVTDLDVRVWIDPLGFPVLPPLNEPPGHLPLPLPVVPGDYRVGWLQGAPDPIPVPEPENPVAPAPEPQEVKMTKTNEGIDVTDLDQSWERNSCAPNAIGGSFAWLNKTYKLGLTQTLDQLVQEFRRLCGSLNGKGTTVEKMKTAKEGFIRKHKLPLTVETKGVPIDLDATATPEDFFKELSKGQDVELNYGFYKQDPMDGNKWKRHGGHTVALKSITKCVKNGMTTWTIVFRHDWKQGENGGVDDVEVKITQETKDFDNDGTNETVWVLDNAPFGAKDKTRIVEGYTAESPTLSQLNKCVSDALGAYSATRTAAEMDGSLDLAEKIDMLIRAQELKKAWQRLHDFVVLQTPPNASLIGSATRGLQSACNLRDRWLKRVLEALPGSRSVLPEDDLALSVYEEDSMATFDLPAIAAALPPDADFDDVEDGLDNSPLPNPDQADQDGNLIPDVDELSPATDCNDNGLIDVYEVTIFGVIDYNPDGSENLGFIFDTDGNGIPDDCETAPIDCIADLDGDDDVDVFDFNIFAPAFGTSLGDPGYIAAADFDNNNTINVFDFNIFAPLFGCN